MTAQVKNTVLRILLLAGILALAACSGNTSSTTSTPTAEALSSGSSKIFLQGQVADGYLQKAEVFLDLNGNKVLDPGEPETATGPDGRFKLLVQQADADSHPVVVQVVPGQTLDQDSGNRETDPMTLEAPVGQFQFISPLTTLVKNALDKTPGLTVAQAEAQVRTAFGLGTQVPLSADYIAAEQSNDPQQAAAATKMHQTAQVVADLMTTLEQDIAANLGTIPASRTTAVQALVTDIAMKKAGQIANALQTAAGSTAPAPQDVATKVLSDIDPTTLTDSLLALYQLRLDQQNPVWDVTPPQITVQSPTSGQPAPVDTKVTVTFDEGLDQASIPADALTLAYAGGSVDGTVSYDATSRTLTFIPTAPLPADTAYTVTLAAGIADTTGNALSQPTSWSFNTIADIAPPPPPAF